MADWSISFDLDAAKVASDKSRNVYGDVADVLVRNHFKNKTMKNIWTASGLLETQAKAKYDVVLLELVAANLLDFFTGLAFFELKIQTI